MGNIEKPSFNTSSIKGLANAVFQYGITVRCNPPKRDPEVARHHDGATDLPVCNEKHPFALNQVHQEEPDR